MGRPLFGCTHTTTCLCPKCTADADAASTLPPPAASTPPRPEPSSSGRPPRSAAADVVAVPVSILQTISESQASLSRASSVIEAAYTRLLALRIRLRENSEIMSLLSQAIPRMGPDHSAIVLSAAAPQDLASNTSETPSDMIVDPAEQSTSLVPVLPVDSASPALQTAETIRRRFQELAGSVPGMPALPELVPYSERSDASQSPARAPSTGSGVPSIRRTSFNSAVNPLRTQSSNDPSTTLGRRVEARTAGTRSVSRNIDDAASRIMELRSNIDNYINRLNRHGEELLAAASSLRQDLSPRTGSSARNTTSVTVSGANRRLVTSQQLRQEFERDDDPDRNWTNTPNLGGEPTSRLSISEGDDTPVAGTFDSALSAPQVGMRRRGDRGDDYPMVTPSFDPSDSEDEENQLDWSVPDRPRRIQIPSVSSARLRTDMLGRARAALLSGRRFGQRPSTSDRFSYSYERSHERFDITIASSSGSTTSSLDPSRPRRRTRGWARLDRDGNEIPTDEEEEYERNRAHMRERAQALSAGVSGSLNSQEATTPPPPPPNHQRYPYIFTPTTRSDVPTDTPAGYDPSAVRVRLSPRNRDTVSNYRPRTQPRSSRRGEPGEGHDVAFCYRPGASLGGFNPSPLPWSPVDLSPPLRVKERRMSGKVRASTRPPLAGR